ncbi:MAG: pseudouridine synthase [Phycisphaerales bacterium]
MAEAGVASRRECERLIEAGAVEVNGQVVTQLPVFVDPAVDRIVVEGRPIRRQPERKLYLLLNKPARTLTTLADEPGADRRTVMDLVDHPQKARLFPVGRLDYDTTGLLLLTNDGELANRLTHPRFGVPKTYRAVVKGHVEDEAIAELERGIYLADRKAGKTTGASRTAHVEVRIISRQRDRTVLELTLREGRNRQVRRLLAAVGFPVRKLERIAMGPLSLKGVARGQWRELDRHEIRALKRAAALPDEPKPSRTLRREQSPNEDE